MKKNCIFWMLLVSVTISVASCSVEDIPTQAIDVKPTDKLYVAPADRVKIW